MERKGFGFATHPREMASLLHHRHCRLHRDNYTIRSGEIFCSKAISGPYVENPTGIWKKTVEGPKYVAGSVRGGSLDRKQFRVTCTVKRNDGHADQPSAIRYSVVIIPPPGRPYPLRPALAARTAC